MTFTLTLPETVAQSIEQIARISGTPAERLLLQALESHFPPVPQDLRGAPTVCPGDDPEEWRSRKRRSATTA